MLSVIMMNEEFLYCNAECHYAECRLIVILRVIVQNVVMLRVIVQNVVMLSLW